MTDTQIVPARPAREVRVVQNRAISIFDTAKFEHMQRVAQVMASTPLLPDHLRSKNPDRGLQREETLANCFLIVNQADRWNADPFAIAPETYVARGGKLAYQGKLVAAVINTRPGLLQKNLYYTYTGSGDGRTVTVHGLMIDEDEPRTVDVTVGDVKTDNKMWTNDPDQKLVYNGNIKWARRHAPEVVLGIMTVEDLEFMEARGELVDITPRPEREDYRPAPTEVITEPARPAAEPVAAKKAAPKPKAEKPAPAPESEPKTQVESDPPPTEEPSQVVYAFVLVMPDGEELPYEDPLEFRKAFMKHMDEAAVSHGVPGLDGYYETNRATFLKWAANNKPEAVELDRYYGAIRKRMTEPEPKPIEGRNLF